MPPILLHFGHLVLPTFGVLAALGLMGALFLSLRTARLRGISGDALWNAGLFAIFVAFLSSRVLLVMTNLRSFLAAPVLLLMMPSLTAGGLLVTVLVTAVWLRRHRLPWLAVFDAWAAPGTLLWMALALGHLAEGSDPGLPARRFGLATSLAGYREQPVALYVALSALLLTVLLFARTHSRQTPGRVAALGLSCAGVVQFLLTFLRLPYLYPGPTLLALLDPIQWVALALTLCGGMLGIVSAHTEKPDLLPASRSSSSGSASSVPRLSPQHPPQRSSSLCRPRTCFPRDSAVTR